MKSDLRNKYFSLNLKKESGATRAVRSYAIGSSFLNQSRGDVNDVAISTFSGHPRKLALPRRIRKYFRNGETPLAVRQVTPCGGR
jgi:hypothetical protein